MSKLSQIQQQAEAIINVVDLTMAYGSNVIQKDLTFEIRRGDIFIIMGGSGCGKSTLLKHMIGLIKPVQGDIFYGEQSYWKADADAQQLINQRFGVTFQNGALWSSMTLAENIAIPLQEYTKLEPREINEVVEFKLALVGLGGYGNFYPSELSGGMRKRASIARAVALDPVILFFDEPGAGLDPFNSRRLDNLITELRDSLKTTIVIVTHELASILTIGNNSVFLDDETKTIIAAGDPKKLQEDHSVPKVQAFLYRGEL
jgi:phospholipid/cholesterol/gamma-HCH transport system ATP-binding protein